MTRSSSTLTSLGLWNLSLSSRQLRRSPRSHQRWRDTTETRQIPCNTLTLILTLTTPIPTTTITTTIIIPNPTQLVSFPLPFPRVDRAWTDPPFLPRSSLRSTTTVSSRSRSSRRGHQDDPSGHRFSRSRRSLSRCSFFLLSSCSLSLPRLRRVESTLSFLLSKQLNSQLAGHILAEDVLASHPLPLWHSTNVDGYAVHCEFRSFDPRLLFSSS